jgi:hypothetical protein
MHQIHVGVGLRFRPRLVLIKHFLLVVCCFAYTYALPQPVAIFQEDFDGGIPAEWELVPDCLDEAIWQWSADGRADSVFYDSAMIPALFWLFFPPIDSPTAYNGAAMFNSDAYDSAGIGVGQGPFPSEHEASLITPSINCLLEPVVYLKFNQFARAFRNAPSTLLSVSNDGGESWVDFPVNQAITENQSSAPNAVVLIDISEVAAGQPDVRVRFSWKGRYHFWLIDDVQIIRPPNLEIQLGDIAYAPSSFAQPVEQMPSDTFRFGAYIRNLGIDYSPPVGVKLSLYRRIGAQESLIYSDSAMLSSLPAMSADSLVKFSNAFIPYLPEGDYIIRYDIVTTLFEDFNPTDNSTSFPFRVTAQQYAKEDDLDVGLRPLDGGDYEIGNIYDLGESMSEAYLVNEITFVAAKDAVDGPLDGDRVTLKVYQIDTSVAADFSNFDIYSYDDLHLIGITDFIFPMGSQSFQFFNTSITDLEGEPLILHSGNRYLASAAYEGASNKIFHGFNDDIDYAKVSTILYQDGWYLGGFGTEQASILRLDLQELAPSQEQSLPTEEALRIFPNPAQDYIYFQHTASSVPKSYLLTNIKGQLLRHSGQTGASSWQGHHRIYVGGLAPGIYYLQIMTAQNILKTTFIKI